MALGAILVTIIWRLVQIVLTWSSRLSRHKNFIKTTGFFIFFFGFYSTLEFTKNAYLFTVGYTMPNIYMLGLFWSYYLTEEGYEELIGREKENQDHIRIGSEVELA